MPALTCPVISAPLFTLKTNFGKAKPGVAVFTFARSRRDDARPRVSPIFALGISAPRLEIPLDARLVIALESAPSGHRRFSSMDFNDVWGIK
jgi:hypothetical protein